MTVVRLPVAAGAFYPPSRDALARLVDGFLAAAARTRGSGELRALVVPHAGYAYSGATAAAAFAVLPEQRARVALLGPSHFVRLSRPAVTGADAWRTPLGDVPVDPALRAIALDAGGVVDAAAHGSDHALEVELPFLQRRLGPRLRAVMVAVDRGRSRTAQIVAALADKALLVVSTDLSHYSDDATARRLDRRTAEAVLALDDAAIRDQDACGASALRVLVAHAREHGWECTLLDLRTSGDATGDLASVVGYGAFAFTEAV